VQHIQYAYNIVSFNVYAEYNSQFANYHGNAVGYFANTWENTQINSFGIQAWGVNVGWSSISGKWEMISPNDKLF